MRATLTLTTIGLLLLSACSQSYRPEYRSVVVNEQFRLDIPASMQATNELHDFASLQYADEQNGFFLIGIVEPKEDLENLQLYYSIEDYADFVQRTVGGGLDTFNITTTHAHVVNGYLCNSADLFGAIRTDEGPLEVYYRVTVMESPTYFYQLIGWSGRDNAPVFRSIANQIECSFREQSVPSDPDSLPPTEPGNQAGAAAEANPA
ncbi:MAG: hypothetical protein AAGN35_17695 [Bacteroidota bacterium]